MAIITEDIEVQADIYKAFKANARRARERIENNIATMAAGPISADSIVSFYRQLDQYRTSIQGFAATPGIAAIVQDLEESPTYDVVAEIGTVVSAIDTVLGWVDTNFPESAGYKLMLTLSDGNIVYRTLSSAATANFRTVLQVILDAIDAE